MPPRGIAHPSHRSDTDFAAMAWAPSYRAPRAKDVLNAPPFVPPQGLQLCREERELLDAVIACPEDDVPRSRMAEWYSANGKNERAAFIRDQLAGRLAIPNPEWAAIFEPWCARDLVYRRGFVEALSLSGRSFITLGEPLFQMTPLREVRLVAISPYIQELIACPHLSRLKVLILRGNHIDPVSIQSLEARGVQVL